MNVCHPVYHITRDGYARLQHASVLKKTAHIHIHGSYVPIPFISLTRRSYSVRLETFRLAGPAAGSGKALRRPRRRRPGTGPRRHRLQPSLSGIPGTRKGPRQAAVVRHNRDSGYEGYPRVFLISFRAHPGRPCFQCRAVTGIVKHPGHTGPSLA